MFQLFVYDHCPYCVKARMIFGFKGISFKMQILSNEDEKTPVSMIGVKMVPILKKEDGSFMGESLDIIRFVDRQKGKPAVSSYKEDKALSRWMEEGSRWNYSLAMPRWVQSSMEEFQTKNARRYFTAKKERFLGPFKEALANTKSLIQDMEEHLSQLESMMSQEKEGFFRGVLTVNDFHLFAFLRSLTVVKGLNFPPKTASYLKILSKKSKVPLNFDIAL